MTSPLQLTEVPGIRLGTVSAGIKVPGRKDLVLIEMAEGTRCAAVFTLNAFCAAPVTVARQNMLDSGHGPRYLLVNTGNANAGTGSRGIEDARACTAATAKVTGVSDSQVLPFSTGVIGESLPVDKICDALPSAFEALSAEGWADAAEGILTTDTRAKGHSIGFSCAGQNFVVTGIAKGAGMIRPNMATMLAYIATDMAVEQDLLQGMLHTAMDASFHRITVDGDTSTNDACVLMATGSAANERVSDPESELYRCLR